MQKASKVFPARAMWTVVERYDDVQIVVGYLTTLPQSRDMMIDGNRYTPVRAEEDTKTLLVERVQNK